VYPIEGLIEQEIDYTFHMFTCSDTVYGPWQGGMSTVITTTLTTKSGEQDSRTNEGSGNFPLAFEADDGTYSVETGEPPDGWAVVEGKVDEEKMELNYQGGIGTIVYDFSASGPVKPGAVECEEKR